MEPEEWPMPDVVSGASAVSYQYDALVSRLKQTRRQGRAPAIAIVSWAEGAGVSTVTKELTGRMNAGLKSRRTEDVTVAVPAAELIGSHGSIGEFVERIFDRHGSDLEHVFDPHVASTAYARGDGEREASLEDCLLTARSLFRMVLVECRPLKKSADITSVAFMVDAVLIVVEANKTTRAQTERLVHIIHTAGGSVLGYVLNKRTFPVPSSIYKLFEKAGLV
jgi:hypothetical protein